MSAEMGHCLLHAGITSDSHALRLAGSKHSTEIDSYNPLINRRRRWLEPMGQHYYLYCLVRMGNVDAGPHMHQPRSPKWWSAL